MKVTKTQLKQIIKEELLNILNEASYRQHQGGWYGTGSDAEVPQESGLSSDERISVDVELRGKLEEEGMDWILDDIEDDLYELAATASSPNEYRLKLKQYLNSKASDFGYSDLGDAVYGD